jgi:glycosyltransferase involved in cell wall biosynthesis
MIEPKDILFVGLGATPVCWYRCALPAMNLGADWVGVYGKPPHTKLQTGLVRRDTRPPDFDDYQVIVLQQPHGQDWQRFIRKLQASGKTVLYEVDDYLHGIEKVKGHHFGKWYTKKRVTQYEICMRMCDGLIVSTEYLGRRYRKFNKRVYVCRNGLDLERYRLTIPERSTVNIGWSGATGHAVPLVQWLNGAVLPVMGEHDDTCFVSIGGPEYAGPVQQEFGEERAIGIPFTFLETYPAAMTMLDIALAPAGRGNWYEAKSDLRWLEASALGIPIIADPFVYREIKHGVTGFHASDPSEAASILRELVEQPELRRRVGEEARSYVKRERSAADAALAWLEVCRAAAGGYESAHALVSAPTA